MLVIQRDHNERLILHDHGRIICILTVVRGNPRLGFETTLQVDREELFISKHPTISIPIQETS